MNQPEYNPQDWCDICTCPHCCCRQHGCDCFYCRRDRLEEQNTD